MTHNMMTSVKKKKEEVTTPEQNVTPDVPDKGTNITLMPEDENSEDVEANDLVNKGPSIKIQKCDWKSQ